MKNSIVKSTLAVVVVAASSYGALKAYNSSCQNENQILLENVEALSGVVETNTTWGCDGQNKTKCHLQCGRCLTEVNGRGNATGSHSCIVVTDPQPSGRPA